MALNVLVEELHELFPMIEDSIIKDVIIDCNCDKNAAAEVLACAQDEANFNDQLGVDHSNDVSIVYKDGVVTMSREELQATFSSQNHDEEKEKEKEHEKQAKTMNEMYKKYAEEDEANCVNDESLILSQGEIKKKEKTHRSFLTKNKKGSHKENKKLIDDK